jgi:hypothetical protein
MKNKRKGSTWLIVILIIVIIIGVGFYYLRSKPEMRIGEENNSQGPSNNQNANLKTYIDPQSRFSFSYPSEWNFHTMESGVYVLTKQHDASDSPGGKNVDFSVSVCKLSDKICAIKKKSLDEATLSYSRGQDTSLILKARIGHQYVTAGAGYYYSAVIEDKGNLYVLGSTVEEYETRYPAKMSNPQVKAIFDSFTFAK